MSRTTHAIRWLALGLGLSSACVTEAGWEDSNGAGSFTDGIINGAADDGDPATLYLMQGGRFS